MRFKHALTVIDPLDQKAATHVGELLALCTSADVVDGHVAVTAVRTGGTVLTSGPEDLQHLVPGMKVVAV